ncbi:MAG TPA: hypothetical protein VK933_03815, partial [Longimicrobiales bacterium]|nr:hypothetical protein [Longimicrobiales bacterium]
VSVIGLAFLAACSDTSITDVSSPERELRLSAHGADAAIDVSGEWLWSDRERLILPEWAATLVFGIQPEGPRTSAICEGSGTMTLVQEGAVVSGEWVRTSQQCVTRGGQVFDSAPFLPAPLVNGEVRGRNLVIQFGGGNAVDCTFRASITVNGQAATALSGGGTCIVPGHPKSNVPLDPPPGGVDKILSFSAVRP